MPPKPGRAAHGSRAVASEKGSGVGKSLNAHKHLQAHQVPPSQHLDFATNAMINSNTSHAQHLNAGPSHHSQAAAPVAAPSFARIGPVPGPSPGPGPGGPDHRTPQPYQNVAPLHHVQQPQHRNLNSNQTPQQPYPSPNVFTPQSGIQSPYLNQPAQFQAPQGPTETSNYYSSNPSPRSQHSGAGAFYPPEKPDSMAATATMQRPYPPIYNTPQSNSPASVTSPQSHDHGRPLYGQPGSQLTQPMYGYPQYQSINQVHQPSYGGHHNQPQQHQMNSQPMMPYQSTTPQLPQGQVSSHHSTISSSPRLKNEANQPYPQSQQARPGMVPQKYETPAPQSTNLQQPGLQQSMQQSQPQNPPPTSNAAPGPIPATTPLVVRQDGNGVQWITFEYSRDRVKMDYMIRCDVESVDTNALTADFKSENCVYPRACVPKEQYKGNRLAYETDCNQVGWALADLNPCLRGKRGLIQRAVDSWRNSNQDPRLRSRRVRRQAKMNNRSKLAASAGGQTPGSAGPVSTGLPGPNSMAAPSVRPPNPLSSASSQILHHQHEVSPPQDNVGAAPYGAPHQAYRQNSGSQHMASPNDLRQSHVFPGYQNYPAVPTSLAPSMAPSMQGGLHHLGRPSGTAGMASKDRQEKDEEDNALFGELPEGKRRKFILVEDTQKNARVRVKVTLDQIEMSEIPDSYRKQNSVFPRAYFPVQMRTAPEATRGDRFTDEGEEVDGGAGSIGKVSVPIQCTDGEAEVDVPHISRGKRSREQKLNELGNRIAWGQGRVFSGRPVFLAKALDAYRSKQRSALLTAGQEASSIPAHLETRPGKRRWHERTKAVTQAPTPPTAVSD